MQSATRTSLALAAALVVLLLLICCTVTTCTNLFTNQRQAPEVATEQECDETHDDGVSLDDGIDQDAPPGVTGEVVRITLDIPAEVPCDEAVMINADRCSLPRTDDGEEVAIYLYDDPADEELNLIVESDRIATEVWWEGSDGEWCSGTSIFCLIEEGSDKENIEFLMPLDTSDWGEEITIGFSPVR